MKTIIPLGIYFFFFFAGFVFAAGFLAAGFAFFAGAFALAGFPFGDFVFTSFFSSATNFSTVQPTLTESTSSPGFTAAFARITLSANAPIVPCPR